MSLTYTSVSSPPGTLTPSSDPHLVRVIRSGKGMGPKMGLAEKSLMVGRAQVISDLILTANVRAFPQHTEGLEFVCTSLAVSLFITTVAAAHDYQTEISTRAVSSPFPARALQTCVL